jgi:hypothetical protein
MTQANDPWGDLADGLKKYMRDIRIMFSRDNSLYTAGDYLMRAADVVVATGAVTFPWWRAGLHEWSAIAADVMPFFAITWLAVQIGVAMFGHKRHKSDDD